MLGFDVSEMARRFGLERLAMISLGFDNNHEPGKPHPAWDPKEAARRFHSLATNFLDRHFLAWKRVIERGEEGNRLHYHIVVACRSDVRTGFDFDAYDKGARRYNNNAALAELWDLLGNQRKPGVAVEYGFGARVHCMPIRSCEEAIGKYVSKYIGKHMGNRLDVDKGIRLVGGSKSSKFSTRAFSWHSPRASLWRAKKDRIAKIFGFESDEDFAIAFGAHWAWRMADLIMGFDLVKDGGGTYTYSSIEHAMADGRMLPDEIPDVHGPITITSVDLVDEVPEVISLAGHPSKIPLRSSSSFLGASPERPPVPAAIAQAQADRNALIEAGCRRAAAEVVGLDEPIRLETPVSVNLGRQYRALRAHLRSLPDGGQASKPSPSGFVPLSEGAQDGFRRAAVERICTDQTGGCCPGEAVQLPAQGATGGADHSPLKAPLPASGTRKRSLVLRSAARCLVSPGLLRV